MGVYKQSALGKIHIWKEEGKDSAGESLSPYHAVQTLTVPCHLPVAGMFASILLMLITLRLPQTRLISSPQGLDAVLAV